MPLSVSKPTFTFFKLLDCSACEQFQSQLFERLVNDPDVLNAVNLDEVVFGRDADGTVYSLEDNYPDFVKAVTFAPYLWLAPPYDERLGYHLEKDTMSNPSLNLRLNGKAFSYRRDTTYEKMKNWLLLSAKAMTKSTVTDRLSRRS
jgi:hypothetical protein